MFYGADAGGLSAPIAAAATVLACANTVCGIAGSTGGAGEPSAATAAVAGAADFAS